MRSVLGMSLCLLGMVLLGGVLLLFFPVSRGLQAGSVCLVVFL